MEIASTSDWRKHLHLLRFEIGLPHVLYWQNKYFVVDLILADKWRLLRRLSIGNAFYKQSFINFYIIWGLPRELFENNILRPLNPTSHSVKAIFYHLYNPTYIISSKLILLIKEFSILRYSFLKNCFSALS